jgi:hypothetical protein
MKEDNKELNPVKVSKPKLPHHVLKVERYSDDGDCTLGKMYLDNEFQCYTLEDEQRDEKVQNETRIDAGTYKVAFKKNVTNLTKKYRSRFSWFKWHIEIKELPKHSHVYIHIGNTDEDTAGCILVGKTVYKNTIGQSVKAYTELYKKISDLLEAGHTIEIQIINKEK